MKERKKKVERRTEEAKETPNPRHVGEQHPRARCAASRRIGRSKGSRGSAQKKKRQLLWKIRAAWMLLIKVLGTERGSRLRRL